LAAKEEEIKSIVDEIHSEETPELGLQGLPIWSVFQTCHYSGAGELADQIVGAMMAYEAGMLQRTNHSTLLFFVSAIEALTEPNLNTAKTQRLSKRFSYFLEEFCSAEATKVMNHANFNQAFGGIKSRKKILPMSYTIFDLNLHILGISEIIHV